MQDDFKFFAMANPSIRLRGDVQSKLPNISGVFRQTNQMDAGTYFIVSNTDKQDFSYYHVFEYLMTFDNILIDKLRASGY